MVVTVLPCCPASRACRIPATALDDRGTAFLAAGMTICNSQRNISCVSSNMFATMTFLVRPTIISPVLATRVDQGLRLPMFITCCAQGVLAGCTTPSSVAWQSSTTAEAATRHPETMQDNAAIRCEMPSPRICRFC